MVLKFVKDLKTTFGWWNGPLVGWFVDKINDIGWDEWRGITTIIINDNDDNNNNDK